MHLDEIADAVDQLPEFAGAVFLRGDRILSWQWPRPLDADGITVSRVRAELDADGHFILRGVPQTTGSISDLVIVARNRALAEQLYGPILRRWSALYADLARGIVRVGVTAALVGQAEHHSLHILAADPAQLGGRTMTVAELEPFLFCESCRQFVYSTIGRFRQFGQELAAAREEATSGPTEPSRTSINNCEPAIGGYTDSTYPSRDRCAGPRGPPRQQPKTYRRIPSGPGRSRFGRRAYAFSLADGGTELRMGRRACRLRVSIAERSATRSFTAAVFAVAAAALLWDVAGKSVAPQHIHWTDYRIGVLAATLLGVSTLSFLLFLVFRRIVR